MPNPVVHFEIIAKDPRALNDFYRKAFDWNIDDSHAVPGADPVSEYFMVLPDGSFPPKAGINGGIGSTPEGYDGHVTFYVSVDDVEAALAKIEQLGGTRMMGPQQVPDGPIIGLFQDPQGHVVGVVKTEM